MSGSIRGLLDGVDHHQIYLIATSDSDHYPIHPAENRSSNDLLSPTNDGVCVFTGIAMGVVDMSVELLDSEPSSFDTSRSWEVINEVSFHATAAEAYFMTLMNGRASTPFDRLQLPEDSGWYRVRGHANGRSIDFDGVVTEDPQEHHLLQLWATPESSDSVDHLVDDQWALQGS